MNAHRAGAREEWRAYWFLPFIAALGYSTASLPSVVCADPAGAEMPMCDALRSPSIIEMIRRISS